jgi:hypothetical protein
LLARLVEQGRANGEIVDEKGGQPSSRLSVCEATGISRQGFAPIARLGGLDDETYEHTVDAARVSDVNVISRAFATASPAACVSTPITARVLPRSEEYSSGPPGRSRVSRGQHGGQHATSIPDVPDTSDTCVHAETA